MNFGTWSAFVGVVLVLMALSSSLLARLPLSSSMLYLAIGAAASPLWLGWTELRVDGESKALEWLAEIVVLLSLFTSGLKMSAGLGDGRWMLPLRLAVVSMLVTVALVALGGSVWLGLPLGAAVLLGAILAPTDPVLASDVQLGDPQDRDRLRFALTGEAGMNDGTAFPFVMLGLGLLGLHELGPLGARWFGIDVVWAVVAGLGIGAMLGTLIGRLVVYLRQTHHEAVGLDNFLALGLIGLSYGLALLAMGYGFLAVFAAGVALRRVAHKANKAPTLSSNQIAEAHAHPDASSSALAVDPDKAPAFMAHAVLVFNEQIERIAEVVAVMAIGMLLWSLDWARVSWPFVAAMFLVVRPVSVVLGLAGSRTTRAQKSFIAWFGIRGIGSLYYLMYAVNHGLPSELVQTLAATTLAIVVVSIFVHGISVTPLMSLYERALRRGRWGRLNG